MKDFWGRKLVVWNYWAYGKFNLLIGSKSCTNKITLVFLLDFVRGYITL